MDSNIKHLYDTMISRGYTGLGDFSNFEGKMKDSGKRKLVYDALMHDDYFSEIGDFSKFESALGYSPVESKNYVSQSSANPAPIALRQEADVPMKDQSEYVNPWTNSPDYNFESLRKKGKIETVYPDDKFSDIYKSIDENREGLDEGIDKAMKGDVPEGARPIDVSTRLIAARNYLNEAEELINAKKEGGGVLRGMKDAASKIGNWDFGMSDLATNKSVYNALNKFESGEELSDDETRLLDAVAVNTAAKVYASDMGRSYNIGSAFSQSIPFMLEMIVNPLSGAGKGVGKALAGYAAKRFGKKALTKAAGIAGRAAGDMAAATGMAATTGAAGLAADAYSRMTGDPLYNTDSWGIKFGQDARDPITGDLLRDDNGDPIKIGSLGKEEKGKAIYKALASRSIENYSEMFGEYFGPIGDLIKKSKLGNSISQSSLVKAMNKLTRAEWTKGFNQLMKDAKYNGFFGELGEEYVGGLLDAALVGDQSLKDLASLDNLLTTAGSIGLMSGMFGTVNMVGLRTAKHEAWKKLKRSESEGMRLIGDDFASIMDDIRSADPDHRKDVVKDMVSSDRFNEEQKRAIIDFYLRKNTYDGFIYGERKAEDEGQGQQSSTDTNVPDQGDNGRADQGVNTPPQFTQSRFAEAEEQGRNMTDPGDIRMTNQKMEETRASLSEMVPGLASTIESYVDDGASEAQIMSLLDGVNADARPLAEDFYADYLKISGLQDRIDEEIDNEVETYVANNITPYVTTNPDGQSIVTTATLSEGNEERPVYVRSIEGDKAVISDNGQDRMVSVKRLSDIIEQDASKMETDYRDQLISTRQSELDMTMHHNPKTQLPKPGLVIWNGDNAFILQGQDENGDWIAQPAALDKETGQVAPKAGSAPAMPITERDILALQDAMYDAQQVNVMSPEDNNVASADAEITSVPPVEDAINQPTSEIETEGAIDQIAQPSNVENPSMVMREDGTPDFVSSGTDMTLDFLYDKYGDKMPRKIEVTRKSFDESLKKASDALEKAQEAYDDAPIGKEDKAEAALIKARQEYEAIKVEADFWANLDDDIKEASKKPGDVIAKEISVIGDPMSGEELAAMMLANGAIKLTRDSYKKETGAGNNETARMFGLFASPEKGGVNIERAGEILELADRENGTNFFDENDTNAGRDAIIEVLSSAHTRGDLIDYVKRNREAIAERERQAEYNAYAEWCEENYHMSPEEYEAYEESMVRDFSEKQLTDEERGELDSQIVDEIQAIIDEQNEIDAILAQNKPIENENIEGNDESGGDGLREGGGEVLPREQLDQTGGIGETETREQVGTGIDRTDGATQEGASGEVRPIGKGFFGNIYDQFKGKVKEAFDFLVNHKEGDLLGVFHRDGIGSIDLVWGNDNGGLKHIIKRHIEEQNDFSDVSEIQSAINDAISNGDIVRENEDKIVLQTDRYKVSINKQYRDENGNVIERKNWIVTAFDKTKKKGEKKNTPSRETLTTPSSNLNKADGVTLPSNGGISTDKGSISSSENQANEAKSFVAPSPKENETPLDYAERIVEAKRLHDEELKVDTNPSEAQKEAGNYKKGHIKINGFDVTIEQPAGSVRSGKDANGKEWSVTMNNTYGYIRGTEGVDGDHIDVFLGPDMSSDMVYVVDQVNTDGSFDEHKVMMGFPSLEDARSAYLSNYEEGWQGLGNITGVTLDEFKKWIDSSTRKTKPFDEYKGIKREENVVPRKVRKLSLVDKDDYITSAERKHIKAFLESGLKEARVNNSIYEISNIGDDGVYEIVRRFNYTDPLTLVKDENGKLVNKRGEGEHVIRVKPTFEETRPDSDVRFRFIGEKGAANLDRVEEATTRLDNLAIAREMESSGKEAKAIKMATGWERGADKKWRYEVGDFEVDIEGLARKNRLYENLPWGKEYDALSDKLFDGVELTDEESDRFDELLGMATELSDSYKESDVRYLDDYVKDDSLFKEYPELKQVRVEMYDDPASNTGATWFSERNLIRVNESSLERMDIRNILVHEVQHAIQSIEGFAQGGSMEYAQEKLLDYYLQDYTSVQLHELANLRRSAEKLVESGQYKRMPYAVKHVIKESKEQGFYPMWADNFDNRDDAVITVYDTLVGFTSAKLDEASYFDKRKAYLSIAGEVESRNATYRMDMTPEERRNSLASETEDVAREDQIFLDNSLSDNMSLDNIIDRSINDWSTKLNTPVRVIHDVDDITDTDENMLSRKRDSKGWYDTSTGEIVIVSSNSTSVGDAQRTYLHEVVGHHGLRELFGDDFDTFLDNVYRNANEDIRKNIIDRTKGNPLNLREATEEYLAELAERGFDNKTERSLWEKIKDAFLDMLRKAGISLDFKLSDNDLRYILWRSYKNLEQGNLMDVAEDIVMRNKLSIGDYSVYREGDVMPSGIRDNLEDAKRMDKENDARKSRIDKLRDSAPVNIEFNNEYKLNRDSAKQWMKDNIRGEYVNSDTGDRITISKIGANKVTSHGERSEAHLKSIASIPSIIENSIFVDESSNEKGNDKYDSYRYYVCGAKIDGEDYTVKIVVGVKGDSKYYDHRLTQIEKGNLINNLNGMAKSVADNQNALSGIKDTKLLSILQTNDQENARKIYEATGWRKDGNGDWVYDKDNLNDNNNGSIERDIEPEKGKQPSETKGSGRELETIEGVNENRNESKRDHIDKPRGVENAIDGTENATDRNGRAVNDQVDNNGNQLDGGDTGDRNGSVRDGIDGERTVIGRAGSENKGRGVGESVREKTDDFSFAERIKKDNDNIRFREAKSEVENEEPLNKEMVDAWDKVASSDSFKFKEAMVDSLTAIDEFLKLLAKKTKSKILDYENPYYALIALSSKNKADMDSFDSKFLNPLNEAIRALIGDVSEISKKGLRRTWDWSKGPLRDLVKYVQAKHGIERNRDMSVRDGIENLKAFDVDALSKMGVISEYDLKNAKKTAEKVAEEKGSEAYKKTYDKVLGKELKKGVDKGKAKRSAEIAADYRKSFVKSEIYNKEMDKYKEKVIGALIDRWEDSKKDVLNKDLAWDEEQKELDREALSFQWKLGNNSYGVILGKDYSGLSSVFKPSEDGANKDKWLSDAYDFVRDYESTHEKGLVDNLWDKARNVSEYTLRKQYESGLISKSYMDKNLSRFKYFIPLRGFSDNIASDVYDYIDATEIKMGNPVKTAKGRTSEADNPFAGLIHVGYGSITAGNRNLAKQRFLNLASNHDTGGLITIDNIWVRNVGTEENPEWVESVPQIPDNASGEEVAKAVRDHEEMMRELREEGKAEMIKGGRSDIPYKTLYDQRSQHQVQVFVGGNRYVMTVNGNPRLAQAVNGLTNPDVKDDLAYVVARNVKTFMAGAFTSKNVAFSFANLIKDTPYANNSVFVMENFRYFKDFSRNQRLSLFGLRSLGRNLYKYMRGEIDVSDKEQAIFKEFMDNGGATGYTFVETQKEYAKDLADKLEKLSDGNIGKLSPKELVSTVFECFEFMGNVAELVNRYAAYKTSREHGRSIDRSINDAKEVSVNFNKKGAGKKTKSDKWYINTAAWISEYGRDWVLFFNAAVQSIYKEYSMLKNHPVKGIGSRVVPLMFMGGSISLLNNLFMPMLFACLGWDSDDDDRDYFDSLSDHERQNNICIRLTHGRWLKIPLAPDLANYFKIGDIIAGHLSGKREAEAMDVVKTGIDMVSPLNINWEYDNWKFALNLLPTVVQPIAQNASNVNFMGNPIYKTSMNKANDYDPEYTKVYRSTSSTMVELSRALNSLTGGDDVKRGTSFNPATWQNILTGYTGGFGTVVLGVSDLVIDMLSGEDGDMPVSRYPLLSRLLTGGDKDLKLSRINSMYNKKVVGFVTEMDHDYKGYLKKIQDPSVDDFERAEYMVKLNQLTGSDDFKKSQELSQYARAISDMERFLRKVGSDNDSLENQVYELKLQALEIFEDE